LESEIVKTRESDVSVVSAIVETELLQAESHLETTLQLGTLTWIEEQIKSQEAILSQLQEMKMLLRKD
jgi:hypothetical protein